MVQDRSKTPAEDKPHTPPLEWAAAGVGLVLALGALGLIGREAMTGDHTPPAIALSVDSVSQTPQGYVVTFTASNHGGRPAAQVVIEGELPVAGGEPETTEVTFDYIPDHSARKGGLFFEGDPRAGGLTLSAKGFAEP